jgi:hypothetical protein
LTALARDGKPVVSYSVDLPRPAAAATGVFAAPHATRRNANSSNWRRRDTNINGKARQAAEKANLARVRVFVEHEPWCITPADAVLGWC